jgi:chaperonin GroEL
VLRRSRHHRPNARIALQNASSVAALLITTEAIADRPKKEAAPMPHAGGGMGDMDF